MRVGAGSVLPEDTRGGSSPRHESGRWQFVARLGPAVIVSVGYMDPGNWATDLEGGARFGYTLLWVLVASNAVALVLQVLSARLGAAAGLDLAEACRRFYPPWMAVPLWLLAEVAMVACDLAELLGSAIALHMLFRLPIVLGAILTAFDAFVLLALTGRRQRLLEVVVALLVGAVSCCLGAELVLSRPSSAEVVGGLVPRMPSDALYVAIGIVGATVMPHNLFLHSSLERASGTDAGRRSPKSSLAATAVALNAALLVNASILILSGAVFARARYAVTDLDDARNLLAPLLGSSVAPVLFGIGLLLSGQSATITSTLAGQIIMEGFVRVRLSPLLRRLVTRSLALVPALIVLTTRGGRGATTLMITTQVILSLELPFAVAPLVRFTGSANVMGRHANGLGTRAVAFGAAALVTLSNAALILHFLRAIPSAGWRGVLVFAAGLTTIFFAVLAFTPLRDPEARSSPGRAGARPRRAPGGARWPCPLPRTKAE
ncbi:MAG TPA: Nramp family divalent metal transporter [Polyangiaceae bacterium]|nr:Nramp family divalent metal transporter [Polyangiaceae bacterium]